MESIKEIRNRIGLTQEEAARATRLSLRSFADYERDDSKKDTPKYRYIIMELLSQFPLDEEHGLLSVDEIKNRCRTVFERHRVGYGILFGSYATGEANETSDVNLLISLGDGKGRSTKPPRLGAGMELAGIEEELREALGKKVELLEVRQLHDNMELINAVLRDGIKIYE